MNALVAKNCGWVQPYRVATARARVHGTPLRVASLLTILLIAFFVTACSQNAPATPLPVAAPLPSAISLPDKELLVFAAASLSESLAEIKSNFETSNNERMAISYGASQSLAQQIASGAPADVYIAAGKAPMDFLVERQLVGEMVPRLVGNTLVVVVRSDGDAQMTSIQGLAAAGIARIAVADPELSPAGRYAKESLTSLNLWESLQPRMIIGSDVRAALAYVATGNAAAAIVYKTDAAIAKNLKVLDVVPPDSYTPVVYPATVVKASEHQERAGKFLAYLQTDAAKAVFRKYGFQTD